MMGQIRKILRRNKNPLLLSVIFGLLVGSLHITIPSIVLKSLDMISASVTPTVLVVIGLFIGSSKIGKLSEWIPVLFFSIFTLAIFPAGFYFGTKFFGFAPSQFASSIIEAAMPLAITPFARSGKRRASPAGSATRRRCRKLHFNLN